MHKYSIINGDLKFTLGDSEILGASAERDPLSKIFILKLDEVDLSDIHLVKYNPTWRKLRIGGDRVSNRLDRFLLSDTLLKGPKRFIQWVASKGLYDHNHVLLEIDGPNKNPPNPFKFNPLWLEFKSYLEGIKECWDPYDSILM
jgi:hypothetical protein